MFNGSSNKLANKSKDIDTGGFGPEVIPVSAIKPVSNKDGVGFAGKIETLQNKKDNYLINNTAFNAGPSTQATLAALKQIIPVWTIQQDKPRLVASATIPNQV